MYMHRKLLINFVNIDTDFGLLQNKVLKLLQIL